MKMLYGFFSDFQKMGVTISVCFPLLLPFGESSSFERGRERWEGMCVDGCFLQLYLNKKSETENLTVAIPKAIAKINKLINK